MIICVQLLVFLVIAHKKRILKKITPRHIVISSALGVAFGIAFDLLVGRYLGIFDYVLGFHPLFLFVNGALSYGLWFLTIQLLQSERFLSFCGWTIAIGLVYETANYFFPVWAWTFDGSFLFQESVVILAAYCGLAILAAVTASLTTQARFRAFDWQ